MTRGTRAVVATTLLVVCLSLLLTTVFTSTITVTSSSVVFSKAHTIVLNDLVPNACPTSGGSAVGSIQYWNATNASGGASAGSWITAFGSGANSVWLWNEKNTTTGSGGANMNGGNGADCMVPGAVRGGGASLQIGGGAGADVCYGASGGTSTFNSCSSTAGTPYTAHAISNPSFS